MESQRPPAGRLLWRKRAGMAGICARRVLQVHVHVQRFVVGEKSLADGLDIGGVAL